MNVSARLSYSNVVATLALFFALTGTAVAGGKLLITGGNVKNHSLTGVDVKRGSLSLQTLSPAARAQLKGNRGLPGANGPRGDTGPAGAQGATGAQGSAGKGVTTAIETGPDVSDYQDLTPLASHDITTPGDFVIFTALTVHNTGANDEYLNCGFRVNGAMVPAAGVETTAGNISSGTSVGAFSVASPGTVEFICTGNGATSYDVSDITMRVHNLG